MARKQSFSDKFWHDKHGNFVVWQKPNVFLWVWIVALFFSIIMSANKFTHFMSFLGGISIIIWAILEVGWGVNYFRRLLGATVLLTIVALRFL